MQNRKPETGLRIIGSSRSRVVGLALWLWLIGPALAAELPQEAPPKHLGVGACASPQCHGRITAGGETRRSPLMNEYLTWSRRDRHARAYKTLRSERSQHIAGNLGLEDAATAPLCLDCHADNVAPEKRGRSFQISDGVGCEACHGGAERWLDSHANDSSHEDNLARGMYGSDEPQARAELCLSCHLGNQRKPLTHRLMAAGHPRLPFELDAWTHLQPAHFVADDAYRQRKAAPSPVHLWAMGQAVTLHAYASALADPQRARSGGWPEPALYDCYSCHHRFDSRSAAPTESLAQLGLPRLEEIRFRTMSFLDLPSTSRLNHRLRELNAAMADGRSAPVAAAIAAAVAETYEDIRIWQPSTQDLDAMATRLAAAGRRREYRTYTAAEQATLALQAILATLKETNTGADTRARLQTSLDAMFAATQDERRFDAEVFRKAVLKALP